MMTSDEALSEATKMMWGHSLDLNDYERRELAKEIIDRYLECRGPEEDPDFWMKAAIKADVANKSLSDKLEYTEAKLYVFGNSTAVADIAEERRRQIAKSYDAAHDDAHDRGEIIWSRYWGAIAKLEQASCTPLKMERLGYLKKAGALIVAEIERLERADVK